MSLVIVGLGVFRDAAARVKVPASTTRTNARIAASWSMGFSSFRPGRVLRTAPAAHYSHIETMKSLCTPLLGRSGHPNPRAAQQVGGPGAIGHRRPRGNSMTDCTEELCQVEAVSMPVRVYSRGSARRSAPLVLHFHGGAFVAGSLEAGRRVSMLLAEAGAVVVSADYPLA